MTVTPQRFNALNQDGRRGADSADWTEKPAEKSLLGGVGITLAIKTMALYAYVVAMATIGSAAASCWRSPWPTSICPMRW